MLSGYARGRRNLARGPRSSPSACVFLVGLRFGDCRGHCGDHLADPCHTPRSARSHPIILIKIRTPFPSDRGYEACNVGRVRTSDTLPSRKLDRPNVATGRMVIQLSEYSTGVCPWIPGRRGACSDLSTAWMLMQHLEWRVAHP